MDIVETLTAERRRRRLSMRDVAGAVGVSQASIHDWEHETKSPTLRNLEAWAGALGYRLTLVST